MMFQHVRRRNTCHLTFRILVLVVAVVFLSTLPQQYDKQNTFVAALVPKHDVSYVRQSQWNQYGIGKNDHPQWMWRQRRRRLFSPVTLAPTKYYSDHGSSGSSTSLTMTTTSSSLRRRSANVANKKYFGLKQLKMSFSPMMMGTGTTTATTSPKRLGGWSKDFQHGVNQVNDQYLELVWKYAIKEGLTWIAPITILLCLGFAVAPASFIATTTSASAAASTSMSSMSSLSYSIGKLAYDGLYQLLRLAFSLSVIVGSILHLPLAGLRSVCAAVPTMGVPLLNIVPARVAIQVVHTALFFQTIAKIISKTPIFDIMTVFLWQPMMEEIQYRFLLLKLIGVDSKNDKQKRKRKDKNIVATNEKQMVQFIPWEESPSREQNQTTGTDDASIPSLPTTTEMEMEMESSEAVIEKEEETTMTTTLKTNDIELSKKRIFWSSLLFASTRLGWLFCSGVQQQQQQHVIAATATAAASTGATTAATTMTNTMNGMFFALVPFANTIMSPLFHGAVAPYEWTVNFLHSLLSHFSGLVMSESVPILQCGLLLLAIHHTVVTYRMTHDVYIPLYQQHGIVASVGAHMSWTVGKVLLPFRLASKVLGSIHQFIIQVAIPFLQQLQQRLRQQDNAMTSITSMQQTTTAIDK